VTPSRPPSLVHSASAAFGLAASEA
jgi:hypothetical protein